MKIFSYIFSLLFCFSLSAGTVHHSNFSNTGMSYLSSETGNSLDRETDLFLKAKEYVFKREWKRAKNRLKDYLKSYPQGTYTDEAYYWLAQSLNKLSKTGYSLDFILILKEEAYQNLSHLIQTYPNSMWKDDAQSLQYRLAAELATLGSRKQQMLVQEIVSGQKESDRKNTALNAVAEFNPDVKIPILKDLLDIEKDPNLRKRYLYLLAEHNTEEIMLLLHTITEKDSDPLIREEAASLIDMKEMENIPVQLNYFAFRATATNKKVHKELPENTIQSFNLPRTHLRNKKSIEKAVKEVFDNKLKDFRLAVVSHGAFHTPLEIGGRFDEETLKQIQMILENIDKNTIALDQINTQHLIVPTTSHRIQGFQIYPCIKGVKKEIDQISGIFMVRDLDRDKEEFSSFQVDNQKDQLFAMRKGDGIALVVFQFEAEEEEEKQPIYNTQFRDVMGCTIQSTRNTWYMDALSHKTDVMDFGLSKAKIPYKNSYWILIGHIVSDPKKRRFIGRNAELIDNKGKLIVKAAQIFIPVDNPDQYKIGKSQNK